MYGGGKGGSFQDDINDLLKNKRTVQKIYDANYQFPIPPDKPTVVAVPGDHQVTLYWDRAAEASIDPVLRVRDFEGYKIYKSTDPNFSDIFTITDATGTVRGYKPLKQFDLNDGINGIFRANNDLYQAASGFTYNLGDDTGLQHSYIDKEVDNGRRYYYTVVSYDHGDEVAGIFPQEDMGTVRISSTGAIQKDINVAVVTPNAKVAGYVAPTNSAPAVHAAGPASGSVLYAVLDDAKLTGHNYRVTFLDTQMDSVDNNKNGKIDLKDSSEWDRITSFYSVQDMSDLTEEFISQDTVNVSLSRANLIPGTVSVKNSSGSVIAPANYILNTTRGTIRGRTPGLLPSGKYTITYQYYPVFNSPNLQGSPYGAENAEADIFDGMTLVFQNLWTINQINDNTTGWIGTSAYTVNIGATDLPLLDPPLHGYRKAADYEIQFSTTTVDTSISGPFPYDTPLPTRFRIYNRTDSTYIKFLFAKGVSIGPPEQLGLLDDIILMERSPRGDLFPTWEVFFPAAKPGDKQDTVYTFKNGDKYVIKNTKPFRNGDVFTYATQLPKVDNAKAQLSLDMIKVVPNPYVTAAGFEPPLNPGITSGRGERKIEFTSVDQNLYLAW